MLAVLLHTGVRGKSAVDLGNELMLRFGSITRLLANEWGAKGVNINAIAPGYMATDNTAQLRADEDRNKAILDRIPAGRWGVPADLGGTAVFLASSASDYVNGAVIPVDGGWLAR